MIPIADQLAALIRDREQREADPNAAWNAYLEGHYGPERMAAAALAVEARKQELKAERDRITNGLNLALGITPVWKSHRDAEIVGFKAFLIDPGNGSRRVGIFPNLEEATDAINAMRARLNAERERRFKVEVAEHRAKRDATERRTKLGAERRLEIKAAREGQTKLTQASLPQRPNKSGLPNGVVKRETKSGDRYSAVISMTQPDGKRLQRMISTYDTPEEAHDAYRRAHIKVHGEASRYWNQRHEL